MMNKLEKFIKTMVLGGVIVLLPVFLTGLLIHWLVTMIIDLIKPLTVILVEQYQFPGISANLLVITVIVGVCFFVGLFIKTKVGRFIHDTMEKRILKVVPGYTLFRNTVKQFLGQKKSPFSRVALVKPYGNETMMTAFITDIHPGDLVTVFAPSALNPTTGLIFHLEKKYVQTVNVSVEDTMRSLISCGAGSCKLLAQRKDIDCLDEL